VRKVRWECPRCRYSLEDLVEDNQAICPECGLNWTHEQLAEIQGFFVRPSGRKLWLPLLTPFIFGAGAVLYYPLLGLVLASLWSWLCATLVLRQMMRPRLEDFAVVVASIVGLIPAAAWTGLWYSVLGILLGFFGIRANL
jgi:hypothetical protein